jgi:hypothetical protein
MIKPTQLLISLSFHTLFLTTFSLDFFAQPNIASEREGMRALWYYSCPLIITLILIRAVSAMKYVHSSSQTYLSDNVFYFSLMLYFPFFTLKRTPYPPISCTSFFVLMNFFYQNGGENYISSNNHI